MSITYTLSSDNSDNYGCLKFNASPAIDSKVRYRIKSLSTFSVFSITTDDDYIVISRSILDNHENHEHPGELPVEPTVTQTYHFKNTSVYDNLPNQIEQILNTSTQGEVTEPNAKITCSINENGMLKLTCERYKISIIDASHRVKMLMGYYNATLPTPTSNTLISPSLPLTCFGNVLYIRCKSGIVVGSNQGKQERYTNRCYKCLEILIPGLPLVSKNPGYLMTVTREELSQLEFELVDFQDVPVILHAPLHLTIEVYYNAYNLVPINTNEITYNNLCV